MKNRRKFIGHRKNRKHIREEVTKNTQISNKNTFKDESDYVEFDGESYIALDTVKVLLERQDTIGKCWIDANIIPPPPINFYEILVDISTNEKVYRTFVVYYKEEDKQWHTTISEHDKIFDISQCTAWMPVCHVIGVDNEEE